MLPYFCFVFSFLYSKVYMGNNETIFFIKILKIENNENEIRLLELKMKAENIYSNQTVL